MKNGFTRSICGIAVLVALTAGGGFLRAQETAQAEGDAQAQGAVEGSAKARPNHVELGYANPIAMSSGDVIPAPGVCVAYSNTALFGALGLGAYSTFSFPLFGDRTGVGAK
jgi:hypothetical protein